MLCLVGIGRNSLDIARVCKRNYALVTLNKVLKVNLVLAVDYLCTALIGVFSLDFLKLALDNFSNSCRVGKDFVQLLNMRI